MDMFSIIHLTLFNFVAGSFATFSPNASFDNIVQVSSTLVLDNQPASNVSNSLKCKNTRLHKDLGKRTIRDMVQCPAPGMSSEYNIFGSSTCIYTGEDFPRRYSIECASDARPNGRSYQTGFCNAQEICLDTPYQDGVPPRAKCMTRDSWLQISNDQWNDEAQRVQNRLFRPSSSGLNMMFTLDIPPANRNTGPDTGPNTDHIALSSQNVTDSYHKASSISFAPRDGHNANLAEPRTCTECTAVTYSDLPPNTSSLIINIKLKNAHDVVAISAFNWYVK